MRNWSPYVSVANRRASALREMNRLRRKGREIQPVRIDGRTIARSFWGKGWCEHLESFSDFANRLPRGRTYARNGSICHLELQSGRAEAIVSGSSLYSVNVEIDPLRPAAWTAVKRACSGRIGSMVELLQGRLSEQVMEVVTQAKTGLFPQPGELTYECDCPDWASMCKHVSAVMYGIGHRLDTYPELLFTLRGVNAAELISTSISLPDRAKASAGNILADHELGDIFGVEVEAEVEGAAASVATDHPTVDHESKEGDVSSSTGRKSPSRRTKTNSRAKKKAKTKTKAVAKAKTPKLRPTGPSVTRLRNQLRLSVARFAVELDVSASTIYRWQSSAGRLNLQATTLTRLGVLNQRAKTQTQERRAGRV